MTTADSTERADQADQADRAERVDLTEQADRADQVDQVDLTGQSDRADHVGWATAAGTTASGAVFPGAWLMAAADAPPLGTEEEGFVALDAPADPERDAHVRTLRLRAPLGAYLTEVPTRLRDFPNLTELTLGAGIDPQIVANLRPGSVPDSVTSVRVWTGGLPTRWPKGLTLPHVRSLSTDAPTTFGRETFPNLEHAHLAPTKTSFAALLTLPTLTDLHLRTVPQPAPELFETLAHLPLVDLGLLGGRKITGLEGIESLPGLRRLRLQSLPVLTSIAALGGLAHLEELLVLYCSRIADIATVTTLPSLRRFDAYGCTGIGLEEIQAFVDEHSAHRTVR